MITLQLDAPELPRFIDSIFQGMVTEVQAKREDQIKERLSLIGHSFTSTVDWHQFAKERITIASFDDKPLWRELYLDYGKPTQILIGTWWETYNFTPYYNDDCHKMTITAGFTPTHP